MSGLAYCIIGYEWRFELYEGYEFRPWRLVMLLYSCMGIIGGLILLLIRESPRFYLSIKKEEKALEVVKWMYRINKGKSDDDFDILKLEAECNNAKQREGDGM